MPRRFANRRDPNDPLHARLPGYLQVAADERYDRRTGFDAEPTKGGG